LSIVALLKFGFFKREKKEELQRLTKSMQIEPNGLEVMEGAEEIEMET
jgi:hypothetical protein